MRVSSLDSKHRIVGRILYAPGGKNTVPNVGWVDPSLPYIELILVEEVWYGEMRKECFIEICLLQRD